MSTRPPIWIVIADGEHARIVTPGGSAGSFRTVATFTSPTAHLRSSDLRSGSPGRSFESAGTARHAIAPKHDPHRLEMERFGNWLAEQLTRAGAAERFDRLVLVAPPHTLRTIREALDASTASRVTGTLPKDLTKTPDHALRDHLAAWAQPAGAGGT